MSGSPVFLAEARYSFPPLAPGDRPDDPLDELIQRFDLAEGPLVPRLPLLVGIVAETRFVDIPDTGWAQMYAGFGLAFNASTIEETLRLFGYLALVKPYEDRTKKELLVEARAAGIEGRSAMSDLRAPKHLNKDAAGGSHDFDLTHAGINLWYWCTRTVGPQPRSITRDRQALGAACPIWEVAREDRVIARDGLPCTRSAAFRVTSRPLED